MIRQPHRRRLLELRPRRRLHSRGLELPAVEVGSFRRESAQWERLVALLSRRRRFESTKLRPPP